MNTQKSKTDRELSSMVRKYMRRPRKIVANKIDILDKRAFDEENSVLPKWLLENGITCHSWDYYTDKSYLEKRLKWAEDEYSKLKLLFQQAKEKFDKKTYKKFSKEFSWRIRSSRREMDELKKGLKEFNIIYFKAADVEKAFRDVVKINDDPCFLCKKPVTNRNITKDGHYFCSNDCEVKYWRKYEEK